MAADQDDNAYFRGLLDHQVPYSRLPFSFFLYVNSIITLSCSVSDFASLNLVEVCGVGGTCGGHRFPSIKHVLKYLTAREFACGNDEEGV